jgi:hypothetical protein
MHVETPVTLATAEPPFIFPSPAHPSPVLKTLKSLLFSVTGLALCDGRSRCVNVVCSWIASTEHGDAVASTEICIVLQTAVTNTLLERNDVAEASAAQRGIVTVEPS